MKSLFPFLIIFLSFPLHGYAQENGRLKSFTERVDAAPKKNFISISVENDKFGGGTDQFYTSGVRLTYFNVNTDVPKYMDKLADNVPTFDINTTTSTFFNLGHNIYTPEDIRQREPNADDRPWAGFLYGSVGLATLTDNNHIDELELTLGIVGPQAFGEPFQKFVHSHISNSPTPKGWSNQLKFEPGLILSWQRRWPFFYTRSNDHFGFSVSPNVNVSLGNIYTYAGTGLSFSFGPKQEALQDFPPRVRPAQPGSGFFEVPSSGWTWQLFASIDGRAVARNIFLDGNTFRDSYDVDKKYFVGDASVGLSFTFEDYRLSYSYNVRSREFKNQEDDTAFGAVTLTARF